MTRLMFVLCSCSAKPTLFIDGNLMSYDNFDIPEQCKIESSGIVHRSVDCVWQGICHVWLNKKGGHHNLDGPD